MSQAAVAEKKSIYSKRILVLIDRDMTAKTSKVIWAHEKPILEELFGEGMVVEVDAESMNDGYSSKIRPDLLPFNKAQDMILPPSETSGVGFLFVGDPQQEYERLIHAYGKHPDENMPVVEKCYGRFNGGVFAKLLKTPKLTDLPTLQLTEILRAYGAEIPKDATHADLLKLAEEFDVYL